MIQIWNYPQDRKKLLRLLSRRVVQLKDVEKIAQRIIEEVRGEGDRAVASYTKKFDKLTLKPKEFLVSEKEIQRGVSQVTKEQLKTIREAILNIRRFHKQQKLESFQISSGMGGKLGMRYLPVKRAGVYVPGGQAAYPSTVLMNVIPAQVAGVPEIIIATPPNKNGKVPNSLLAAATLLGLSRIYRIGGIQAIAAMTIGTKTVPAVDVIVGPGNKYVTAAKKAVMGHVGIDSLAGPSEVVIMADDTARPEFAAADMLAQAEHAADAMSCLVTPSKSLAEKVSSAVERFIKKAERKSIIRKSLKAFGRIVITPDMAGAEEVVNLIAPEHLEIITAEPRKELDNIYNAGAIFLGNYSPVAAGDYFAGPNHVLPTAGSARFASPLSILDFIKGSSVIEYTKEKMASVSESVAAFAEMEGFHAHALSARIRRQF